MYYLCISGSENKDVLYIIHLVNACFTRLIHITGSAVSPRLYTSPIELCFSKVIQTQACGDKVCFEMRRIKC